MRILSRKSDPLEQHARNLLPLAHRVARESIELKDRYTDVEQTEATWWLFLVAVAVVFVASTRLRNLKLGREREERLMEIVARDFQSWDPRAYDTFEDCKAFFDRTYDGMAATLTGDDERFASSDPIGGWISWNFLDHAPQTEDERALARQVGVLVTAKAYRAWAT